MSCAPAKRTCPTADPAGLLIHCGDVQLREEKEYFELRDEALAVSFG